MIMISTVFCTFIFGIIATAVTIGGSRNTHEQEASDQAQLEYCKDLQKKNTKKKK